MLRWMVLPVFVLAAAWAQQYDGPRPPKPDIPYLKHASNLIPTETAEAKEEKKLQDLVKKTSDSMVSNILL